MGQAAPRHDRRARTSSQREGRRTVVLTLVSAVADGYIHLRALDRAARDAQQTAQSLGEAARVQQVRFEEGAVPESDYRQAESHMRPPPPRCRSSSVKFAQQENFISVSARQGIRPHCTEDIDTLPFPAVPGALPRLSPGTQARCPPGGAKPDRRQRQHRCGKAAYFPRISLTGFSAAEAPSSRLFTRALQSLVLRGRRAPTDLQCREDKNQWRKSEGRAAPALFAYQKSIIVAFQDVENALVDRTKVRPDA